jgi:hypothetical protein
MRAEFDRAVADCTRANLETGDPLPDDVEGYALYAGNSGPGWAPRVRR